MPNPTDDFLFLAFGRVAGSLLRPFSRKRKTGA